ncbi:unnamed protein product, partial [Prorocentrum cordatum]
GPAGTLEVLKSSRPHARGHHPQSGAVANGSENKQQRCHTLVATTPKLGHWPTAARTSNRGACIPKEACCFMLLPEDASMLGPEEDEEEEEEEDEEEKHGRKGALRGCTEQRRLGGPLAFELDILVDALGGRPRPRIPNAPCWREAPC